MLAKCFCVKVFTKILGHFFFFKKKRVLFVFMYGMTLNYYSIIYIYAKIKSFFVSIHDNYIVFCCCKFYSHNTLHLDCSNLNSVIEIAKRYSDKVMEWQRNATKTWRQ